MDVLFIPNLFTNGLYSIFFLILWAFIYMWSLYCLTDEVGGGRVIYLLFPTLPFFFFFLSFFLRLQSSEIGTNTSYNSNFLLKIEFHVPKVNLFGRVPFGLVLWHIDYYRSFNAKPSLCIYIAYKGFGLIGFYGISTLVWYLMPNPFYSYIKYIISKHLLKITFLNELGLIFSHS